MILIYWKWKVGQAVAHLATHLGLSHEIHDDQDPVVSYDDYDLIIPSPGIPPTHAIYQTERVVSELDWAYQYLPSGYEIISVTGTDGKSTTTWMIYSILDQLTKVNNQSVYISGNFEVPFSETVCQIRESGEGSGYIVVEVSSFMAHMIGTRTSLTSGVQYHSDYSILTNFRPDHLNWHDGLQDYMDAKMRLIESTSRGAMINYQVVEFAEEQWLRLDLPSVARTYRLTTPLPPFEGGLQTTETHIPSLKQELQTTETLSSTLLSWQSRGYVWDMTDGDRIMVEDYGLLSLSETHFSGSHNAMNILSVLMVMRDLGIPYGQVCEVIQWVTGLPHRIEYVTTRWGVDYIDDSKSTSCQSLMAALSAFDHTRLVLIAGGSDKGDTFEGLEYSLVWVRHAILIGATRDILAERCQRARVSYQFEENMLDAVTSASRYVDPGCSVLLSPGCASFGLFRDYLDRANQFRDAIQKLPE